MKSYRRNEDGGGGRYLAELRARTMFLDDDNLTAAVILAFHILETALRNRRALEEFSEI